MTPVRTVHASRTDDTELLFSGPRMARWFSEERRQERRRARHELHVLNGIGQYGEDLPEPPPPRE